MAEADQLVGFVERVRRRWITHTLLREGTNALTFGLAALVILLLVGTQIMAIYWPLLLMAAAFAFGLWRLRGRIPTSYMAALGADQRLATSDAISTALFYQDDPSPWATAQRGQAAAIATTASLSEAMPWLRPRTLPWAGGLLVLSLALLVARYGTQNSLDLAPPVTPALGELLRFDPVRQAMNKTDERPDWVKKQLEQMGLSIEDGKDEQRMMDAAKEGEITSPDIPDVNDLTEASKEGNGKADIAGKGDNPGTGPGEDASAKGESTDGKEGKEGDDGSKGGDQGDGKKSGDAKSKQGGDGKSGGNPKDKSSLLDKMREAFNNMMNKVNPEQNQGDQKAQDQKGNGEKSGASEAKSGQKSQSKEQAQNGEGQPQNDPNAEQNGESDQGQQAKGQGSEANGGQAPPDAKAGVGKSDGDKAIQDAKQLDAMGKISEILGKRAKQVQGEVMVEVTGSKQQLKTQYSQSGVNHTDKGGEIHRDSVPARHQEYIKAYFEELRKASAPDTSKK